jgi:hypothetical protein
MLSNLSYGVVLGVLALACTGLTAAQVPAPDVKGVWKGTMETQMGTVETIITIDAVSPLAGRVQLAEYTGAIERGVLDGQKIAFQTTIQPGTITFEGTVAGDQMNLDVTGTTGNKMTLIAKRQR